MSNQLQTEPSSPEGFWEARYNQRDQLWSGKPNDLLVREIEGVAPGTALDLGCGEGGDAIWLAERGWHVTAADISTTALARGAAEAERRGLASRIEWQQHNLAESFPAGTFDLVSSCYLHSPVELPREQILRAAAASVKPGGTLLIAGHAGFATWQEPNPDIHFPTSSEVLDSLELEPGAWQVQRMENFERVHKSPEGEHGTRDDNVLRILRLPVSPSV